LARPEVTGKAPPVGLQQHTDLLSHPPTGPPTEKKMSTIAEFCRRNSISRAHYYELKKRGLTPREVRDLGRIPFITVEAEDDWRAARNAAAEVAMPDRRA
jgi:hypothetical protein